MTAALAHATFKDRANPASVCTVQFNPASLKVSYTNKLQDDEAKADPKKSTGQAKQNTRSTTAKLDTEIVFDTTDTGADVRKGESAKALKTMAVTQAPAPSANKGDSPSQLPPAVVEFRWGSFAFVGLIESYNETLDFWSAEGVPLRSTIQISMTESPSDVKEDSVKVALNTFEASKIIQAPAGGRGISAIASDSGNPGAARALAAANGIEDMRLSAGGSVGVSASITLKAAAKFDLSASAGAGASAGFGIGASASAGAGASAGLGGGGGIGVGASAGAGIGFSAGASAGIGFGASAGAGVGASASLFGGAATAGVSSSAGAFAGLGASKTVSVSLPFDPARLLPPPSNAIAGFQVDPTGRMIASGLTASVGARASAGVRFG